MIEMSPNVDSMNNLIVIVGVTIFPEKQHYIAAVLCNNKSNGLQEKRFNVCYMGVGYDDLHLVRFVLSSKFLLWGSH